MKSSLVLAAAAAGTASAAADIPLVARPEYTLAWQKNVSVPFAGYAFLPKELPQGTLLVTAFDATPFFGKSGIYIADASSAEPPVQLTDAADWPNDLTIAPVDWIEGYPTPLAVVGAGFLVPSHKTGGVWVLEPSAEPEFLPEAVKITEDITDYFYHLAEYVDMNGDGRLDVITARSTSGGPLGSLVWLEQPASDALSGQFWVEHELAVGPDFLFALEPDTDGTALFSLAAAEYFGEAVAYYWHDGSAVQKRIIDSESGPGFSCTWVDLNNDGVQDLLATNHYNQGGSVFAYTFDGDLRDTNTTVTKFVLATGFNAYDDSPGSASPGVAVPFQPVKGKEGVKPLIFLSNDDGRDIYLLAPSSEDLGDMNYDTQRLADFDATIGGIAIGDIDGDGFADIFIPAYDNDELVHYEVEYTRA